jgi:hypothetical protein
MRAKGKTKNDDEPALNHSLDLNAGFLLISEIGSDRISRTSKEL